MRYAPAGKWFVRITNTETGKSGIWPYDGFRTKKAALEFLDKLAALPEHQSGVMVARLEK